MIIEELLKKLETLPFAEQLPWIIGGVIAGLLAIPFFLSLLRFFGMFVCVRECEAKVYTLFGKVVGTIDQPGLNFPLLKLGPGALLIPFFGKTYTVSTKLRQYYMRNQMVNSEEGTPMGVGIWYEMRVEDPVAYLFSNSDPEGSLQANVASSAISTLSNLEIEKMLEDRHTLSRTVRKSVTPLSQKWGYTLGSVYIRKVSFTDRGMVENITDKVVKRLVQVTSAMKQDGENRVGLIKSETAFRVSQKMAEAGAARPKIVGKALNSIASEDSEILKTVLEVMEVDRLMESDAQIELIPPDASILL